jgi:hypothetical protein
MKNSVHYWKSTSDNKFVIVNRFGVTVSPEFATVAEIRTYARINRLLLKGEL